MQQNAVDRPLWGAVMAGNIAPTITAYNTTLQQNTSIATSNLFKAKDSNATDTISFYSVTATAGGQLYLGGNALTVGQQTIISASQLSSLTYKADNTLGTSYFRVAAFDGTEWSGTTDVTVWRDTTTPVSPVVIDQTLDKNEIMPAQYLFQSPAPTDDVVSIRFDLKSGTGILRVNASTIISAGSFYTMPANNMAAMRYEAGNTEEQAVIGVRFIDSAGNYSGTRDVTLTVRSNNAPVVSQLTGSIAGGYNDVEDLIKATDADGDAIQQYTLRAANGNLKFNGVTYAAGTAISVFADQLKYVQYSSAGDTYGKLQVYANDGKQTSAGSLFTFHRDPVSAPTVTGADGNYTFNVHTSLSSMFSYSSSQPIEYYRFQNTGGGGQLKLNSVNQGSNQIIVAASDLNLVQYFSNTMGSNRLMVSAYTADGGWATPDYIDMNVI